MKNDYYPVIFIAPDAAELTEQMGTKYKFWYRDESHVLSLFKEGRPGTGENWAEKIACELAKLMNIPSAHYEFAEYGDRKGVTTPSLVVDNSRLIHGNELLARFTSGPASQNNEPALQNNYKRRDHTIGRVFGYLENSKNLRTPLGFDLIENI